MFASIIRKIALLTGLLRCKPLRPSPIADMQGNCFNLKPERYNEQKGASTPDFNGLLPIGFCYVPMYTVLPSRSWHGRKLSIGLWLLSKFASKCELSTRRRGATPKLSNRKSEKCTALKGSGRLTVLLSFSLVPKTEIRTTDLNDGDTFRRWVLHYLQRFVQMPCNIYSEWEENSKMGEWLKTYSLRQWRGWMGLTIGTVDWWVKM